ncbi:MAG: hypothetical protein Q8N26_34495 [Myxococcales bacterium]|nr:hypothetical protein [Myxococcales bacterium]
MSAFKTPSALREVLGLTFEPAQVIVMLGFAVVTAALVLQGSQLDAVPAWRVVVAAVLIGDIGAGCLSNFTASTNGFYAARPWLRWGFIAVHGHLVAVAWALSWPLAPAIGLWAWTIGSASVVNLLAGRPAQRFVAGALFATSLLSPLVFTVPAPMQVVSALFTLKVAYAFAVRHER